MGDPLPFVQLPTSVIREPGLTVVARMLYAVVATYADLTTREATLLRSTLAKDLNRSRDTVDRAVVELVKAGLLTVTHRKNDKGVSISSLYTLKHPLTANAQVTGGRNSAATPMGNSAATGMGTPAGMGTGAATPSRKDAATVTAPVRPGSGHGCGTELEPLNENHVTREKTSAAPRRDAPSDASSSALFESPQVAETREQTASRLAATQIARLESNLAGGKRLIKEVATRTRIKKLVSDSLAAGWSEPEVDTALQHFASQRMPMPTDNQWEAHLSGGSQNGRPKNIRDINQGMDNGQDFTAGTRYGGQK